MLLACGHVTVPPVRLFASTVAVGPLRHGDRTALAVLRRSADGGVPGGPGRGPALPSPWRRAGRGSWRRRGGVRRMAVVLALGGRAGRSGALPVPGVPDPAGVR